MCKQSYLDILIKEKKPNNSDKVKKLNIPTFSTDDALRLNLLMKYLKKNADLGWSEYLIMCAVDRFEKAYYTVTTRGTSCLCLICSFLK